MDTAKLREAEDQLRQFWIRQAEAERLLQAKPSTARKPSGHISLSSVAERDAKPKGRGK